MKKIMFNDRYGLTQAVLDGRKTMTRRIVPDGTPLGNWEETVKKSRYKVGEIVAVAQSYHALNKAGYVAPEWLEHTCESSAGYENKMFVRAELMPYRIKITNIKVERLQDISNENCLKEGIYNWPDGDTWTYGNSWHAFATPQEAFAEMIDKVHCKGTWNINPYVFVYEFELLK